MKSQNVFVPSTYQHTTLTDCNCCQPHWTQPTATCRCQKLYCRSTVLCYTVVLLNTRRNIANRNTAVRLYTYCIISTVLCYTVVLLNSRRNIANRNTAVRLYTYCIISTILVKAKQILLNNWTLRRKRFILLQQLLLPLLLLLLLLLLLQLLLLLLLLLLFLPLILLLLLLLHVLDLRVFLNLWGCHPGSEICSSWYLIRSILCYILLYLISAFCWLQYGM